MSEKKLPLDPMTEEHSEDYSPPVDHMISSLDGDVHSQGIKVDHRDWLDMGSEGWQTTPDNVKAAAYQAALATGWDAERLSSMIQQQYKHLSAHMMVTTMDHLKALAADHPLHIEQVKETPNPNIEVRRRQQTEL